jgi:thiosulfate/3-mercaptopyruvate sulfurtransferase
VPEAYARPEMLVETDWLAAHLDDPKLRLIDADYPPAYGRAHIPGAVGHPSDNVYLKTATGQVHVMGPEQAAETLGRMGIGDDSSVVVYEGARTPLAARFWWILNLYGHRDVRILNGGFQKWLAEGRPVTTARPTIAPATFTPRPDPEVLGTCDVMKGEVGRADTIFLDVRADGEYLGTNSRNNKRVGHVPGAVHIEWTNVLTDDPPHVFKPAAELREMLRARGVTPDKNVYVY